MHDEPLVVGRHVLRSRLIVGTGKFENFEVMQRAHEASGADMVTVALRRVDLKNPNNNILNFIDRNRMTLLPNTAGCYTVEEAVQVGELVQELELGDLIKVEVIGDQKTLMPCPLGTVKATERLVAMGFTCMAYCSDDIVLCKRLEEAGAAAVMPLGSPIGSGRGVLNPSNIRLIREAATVPIIVDAGVGCASDCGFAMELGVDGLLVNTAIAKAASPPVMARAIRLATIAGRMSFLAGRMEKRAYASASTPLKDF
ncbi:thiazole synthase [Candidatus Poribacteria bacterium]|nr:thiazole synthase [Candidatus Poribacteria bacterium]